MREALGDGYTEALRRAYKGKVPDSADLVMYWWYNAAAAVVRGPAERFGFITTNSITQNFSRRVIEERLCGSPPIRLTFASLQAGVAHACGQWPTDLGSSDFRFSSSNAPYWNLGCSSQATLAAQVADPIDLVRSRDEGRPDIVKRMGAITKIREGKDPSTQYRQVTPQINSTVGGGN